MNGDAMYSAMMIAHYAFSTRPLRMKAANRHELDAKTLNGSSFAQVMERSHKQPATTCRRLALPPCHLPVWMRLYPRGCD